MRKSLVIICALASFLLSCNSAYIGKNEHGIDIFTIDMDLAPKYRYNETATYFR